MAALRGERFGPVLVLRGIEREQVEEEQIGLVLADYVSGGGGPDLVAEEDVGTCRNSGRRRRRRHLRDHLALDGAGGEAHSRKGQVMVGALLIATQSTCAVVRPALKAAS